MLFPYGLVTLAGLYLLFTDLFRSTPILENILFYMALVFCALSAGIFIPYMNQGSRTVFSHRMFVSDPMGSFLIFTVLCVLGLALLISRGFLKRQGSGRGEYYSLLFFSTLGMMLLISANNLMIAFLGLEIMSIPLYILSGFLKRDLKSKEAALKYFILGAFSTGLFVMGIAFVYGATGSLNLIEISTVGYADSYTMLISGLAMIFVGLGFKIALVPFHMWVPDVYDGAPTPVVSFMSVTVKVAIFAAMVRIFVLTLNIYSMDLLVVMQVLAIITMTWGNLAAIYQSRIKRMLAYSSIAHAGYMLIAVISSKAGETSLAISALVFYLVSYCLMTFGAFAVVTYFEKANENGDGGTLIKSYAGLAYKRPFVAFVMSVFMFSLAGIPLTAGFMGKLYIFGSAIKAGFLSLAIIGVINSLLSVYYYLRVIVQMYMNKDEENRNPALGIEMKIALFASMILILAFGIYPKLLLHFSDLISYISF